MSKWLDIPSAICGSTVYTDGQLVARNQNFILPEVNHVMAEVQAGGPTEVPITSWVEAMELTVTLQGLNGDSLALLARQQKQNMEIRFVEDMMTVDGTKKNVGCKAFLTVIPKGVPEIEVELGEIPENEMTFAVIRYQLYVNNKEVMLIDKFNSIFRVNGKDYSESIESLL